MAINLGSAYGKVSLDSSGIKSGVSQGITSLNKLEVAAQKIGGAMQKVGTAMTIGLTVPIAAFFASSVKSAMEAENALAEMKAVLLSTGGAAGMTLEELTKMASGLQKVTKFSDEEIMSGQSMLLTFTKIGKETFPLATEAMLNMAEKFGGMEAASIQLGKALNDPIAGVSALRRVGVMLTDEQEQQIKAFMAVNDIASAQKVILKELETEFGGLAKAAGDTTAGKFAQLKNAFDDLKEVVGAALIPYLLKLAEALTKMVEAFMAMPSWMQKTILILLALLALAGPVIAFIGTIISTIGTIAGFVGSLSGLGISLAGIGTAITGVAVPAIAALGAALLPILVILAAVILFIGIFALAWKSNFLGIRDNMTMVFTVIKNLWKALMAFLKGDTESAMGFLTAAFDTFGARINQVFEKLFGIKDAWGKFLKFMKTALGSVVSPVLSIVKAINNIRTGAIKLYEDGSGALLDLATAFGFPEEAIQNLLAKVWLIIERVRELRDGAIKLYEDGSGALLNLATAFGFPEEAIQNLLAKVWLIIERVHELRIGAIKLYEDGSGALLNLATAFGFPEKAIQKLLAKVWLIIERVRELRDGAIKLYEDGSGALLNLAEAFGIPVEAAQEFLAKVYSIIDRFRAIFSSARDWIVNAFTKTNWSQLGKYITFGIANGLLMGIPSLILAATKAAEAALAAIKKKLGISSPSKAFQQLGMYSAQGYQLGLARAMSAEDLARTMARPVQNMSNSQQQNITMQFANGLTIRQVQGLIAENNDALIGQLNRALGGA